MAQKKFRLSVIADSMVARLLAFKEVQGIEGENSFTSAIACMVLIFIIACFCVFVGAYWSGAVRHRFYLESVNRSQRGALIGKGRLSLLLKNVSIFLTHFLQKDLAGQRRTRAVRVAQVPVAGRPPLLN